MLMSAASSQIGGIRLAVSGTMIGLLASWTVLAARREFSPCEAAVILALNSALSLVGSTTASVPVVEDGIGLFSLILANVWGIMVSFWFWSDLIFRLPTLETANDVWLFARVNMLGGYRIFVLIMLCIALLAMIARIGNDLAAVREARKEHEEYKLQHGEAAAKTRVEDFVEKAKWATATTAASQGFVVIFVIATVEMTIKYNDLEPEKNLSLPGQTIPFSIGIVVLIDGLFVVCGKGYKWMRR